MDEHYEYDRIPERIEAAKSAAGYGHKTDAALDAFAGTFEHDDLVRLALACFDQAGFTVRAQGEIRRLLESQGIDVDELTAATTPAPPLWMNDDTEETCGSEGN